MKSMKIRLFVTLAATLLAAAGCVKDDGTTPYVRQNTGASQQVQTTAPRISREEAVAQMTEDEKASHDYPFAFDAAAVKEPKQDILAVMIYENHDAAALKTVNYFDKNGYVYRSSLKLDTENKNWFDVILDDAKTAPPVNQMSAEEQNTLRYMVEKAKTYQKTDFVQVQSPKELISGRDIFLIDDKGNPVELLNYDNTITCRDDAEVKAFADWFRYFFHSSFMFTDM